MTEAIIIHLLLYPFYQVLSTVRHELAHASVYTLTGWRVVELRVLPGWKYGSFRWGYVRAVPRRMGRMSERLALLAPHALNLVTVAASGVLIAAHGPPSLGLHARIALAVMLVVSPVVDTGYAAARAIVFGTGDLMALRGRG